MCPNCGVYLIEKEEICPSCGHVMDGEELGGSNLESNTSNFVDLESNYSGVPVSRRVISTPGMGRKRSKVRLLFLVLFIVPIVNLVAALYGVLSSKDPFIRRASLVFMVIFIVIAIVLGIYVYEYGIEFVIDNIFAFIIK